MAKLEIKEELHPAEFRGVPWWCTGGTMRGGRKAIGRPILNSDEQDVDDVGRKERVYVMTGYVAAAYSKSAPDQIAQDYRERRAAITAALEEEGPATLLHPWEGEVHDLICSDFSIDETVTELGIGQIRCEFLRDTFRRSTVPADEVGLEEIEAAVEVAEQSLLEFLAEFFGVDPALIESFTENLAKVQAVYAQVEEAAAFVEQVADDIAQVARVISEAVANAAALIAIPAQLAASIKNVFDVVAGVFPTLLASFNGMVEMFDFGKDDVNFDFTTPAGREKKRNFDLLNATVQGMAMGRAYGSAAGIEFDTVDEIEVVEQILEDQYQQVIGLPGTQAEVITLMTVVREKFQSLLQAKKQRAFKVTRAMVPLGTPRTLAYAMHEFQADEFAKIIGDINGVPSYGLLGGEVRVLSK